MVPPILLKTFVRRLSIGILLCVILFIMFSILFPLPPMKPYSLIIDDRHGQFLQAFLARDGVWRIRTSPDEIPEKLKNILIQKEDRFFYYHPGVNPVSIVRALIQNGRARKRVSGASTITMQIARMLEPKKRTYLNKLVEIFRALQLEIRYSKRELLEMYLSMIPLGSNIEGLKSASLLYYQSPLERLNVAQLFDLILIPNDPNNLQPDKKSEELLRERKQKALEWIANGLYSQQDSIVLWNTGAGVCRTQLPKYAQQFCLRIKNQYRDESIVHSSLDLKIQKCAEVLLSNHLRPWKLKGVNNGAVLIIDNRTKEIVAYVGTEKFDDDASQGQVDAVKALRSPGSTLKPFLYAAQMEKGELTPKTRLLDTPYDAEGFLAENYDGTYSGLVYADEALRRSLNVPMIRMLKGSGVSEFADFLCSIGITSLKAQKHKLGLSMIVGGCGVTLEELTAAYSAFPAGGIFTPPTFVKHDTSTLQKGVKVFSSSTAFMITDILSGLNRPDLPNNFESSMNLPTVAFKTGTSYGRRDAWAIGYTAEYTAGVWVGNVNQKGNPEIVGSKAAAPLLIDILNSISSGHQKVILPAPSDIAIREVCAKSGLAPTQYCDHRIIDYYSQTQTLHHDCDIDKEYLVSMDGKKYFCPSCLGDNKYRIVTFEEYPPELLSFWETIGQKHAVAPPHNPECSRLFAGDGPTITSPSNEMTYYIASKKQKLVLQACSGLDVTEHIWYMDNRYLKRNRAGEKLFITPREGDHVVICLDDKGRMSKVKLTVKYIM